MPTYQYECSACGYAFEKMQGITAQKLRKCPQCGKFKLARLIGAGSGIVFKGSGFYETDYKRAPKPETPPSKECPACPASKGCPAASGQDKS